MSDITYIFRTSLGGFHKGDVTAYIEKLATQHRSDLLEKDRMINALQEENLSLQQQVSLLMMSTTIKPEPKTEPKPEPVSQPAPAPVPAPEPAPAPAEKLDRMELLAYRRAEAMERVASKRAKKIHDGLDDMNQETLAQFETADIAVKEALEAIHAQTAAVEAAYAALSAALAASKTKITQIAPALEDADLYDDFPEDE